MSELNITDSEFEKIKVFFDFLCFDQHSSGLSYPRFERCMSLFTKTEKFHLKEVYMDICGKNKKYITFPRILKSLSEYKNNQIEGKSEDFCRFFEFVLTKLIRDVNEITGEEAPKVQAFSTIQHKHKDCITEVKVFQGKEGVIEGIAIEYDELLANVLPPCLKTGNLQTKILLKLKVLEDLDNDGIVDEDDVRDFITHVFGTHTNKIEFLGFKCSSGKMYFTGNPRIGKPFLLGKHEAKFHYIKLAMLEKGIAYIKPFFTESTTYNYNINSELEEITEECLKEGEIFFPDEEHLQTITDRKEYEKNVLIPAFDDDLFAVGEDNEEITGDDFDDVVSFCDSDDEEGGQHGHNVEQDEHYQFEDLDDIVTTEISSTKLTLQSVFSPENTLDQLVESVKADITREFQFHKTNKSLQTSNDPSVDDLIKFDKEFKKISKKSQEAYKKANEDYDEYEVEYFEEDEFGNLRKITPEEKKLIPIMEPKEVKAKWKSFSYFLKRKLVRFGISAGYGINKVNELLKLLDRNNTTLPTKTSLDLKIKIYEVLIDLFDKRRLLKSFTQEKKAFEFMKRNFIIQLKSLHKHKDKHQKSNDAQKQNISSNTNANNSTNNKQKLQDGKFKLEDLPKISKDLEKLEMKIKSMYEAGDEEEANVLKKKYEFLRKEKTRLLYLRKDTLQKTLAEEKHIDIEKLKKDTEERRKMLAEKKKEENKMKKLKSEGQIKDLINPPVTFGNLDLPSDTEIYRGQEIVKGRQFTDERFPPNRNSLCPFDEENESWILPEGVDEDDITNWETFEWQRIDKIFKSDDYQVFLKGIDASDIIQGFLGDCYFLSAIAALCEFPELLSRLFLFKEKSEDRCYGVYMRINGLWELVLLDDYVPCYGQNKKKFAFSNANGKEMWVVLLEKAWAKINGSYAKAIAGEPAEVFDAITNAYTETTSVTFENKDNIWQKISEGERENYFMTAGTGVSTDKIDYDKLGLVDGHAYTVISCTEVEVNGEKVKLVKMRNPWGNHEWAGEWSDSSPKWTPELKKELVGQASDDGVFYMNFEDFIKYYVTLGICKIHKDYTYSFLKFKKGDALVPQLTLLTLEQNSQIYIQIHQKNPRFLLANGKYGEPTLTTIILVDSNLNYIGSAAGDTRNVTLELQNLPAGSYYIFSDINYRYFNTKDMHGYNITTYSAQSVTLKCITENSGVSSFNVLRSALTSYSKSHFESKLENNVSIYSTKESLNDFPYAFVTMENTSEAEVEVEFTVSSGKNKKTQACIFPDSEYGGIVDKITKKIPGKSSEVFICLKFKVDSRIGIGWKMKTVMSDSVLEEITLKQGTVEDLDEEGCLVQIYHQYPGGYGLILENKTTDALKMQLEVENLSYNESNQSEIPFDLDGISRKFFHLKVVPNSKNISFSFNMVE